jgi:L-alanine-DL-glutamate epimerase-like enolase superfamily enzyme
MKIVRIEVYQVNYKLLDKEYAWSGGHAVTSFVSTLVKILTDEEIYGFAEVCPLGSAYMDAFAKGVPIGIEEIGPLLIGRDPMQIKDINNIMDTALSGHQYIKSPLDVACWDILGKAAGIPVCTLLGGKYMDSFPLYRAISQGPPEKMADDVTRYRDKGYRRFQLKVGGELKEDIKRIRAVQKVLHEGDILVADANTGWLMHEAIRVANAVKEEDIYMEQPCATLEECLSVRVRTSLPVILDEVIRDVPSLMRAYNQRAMDAVNLKISRLGGLTKAKLMRDLCESLGLAMTLEDSWGGDISTAAIAHFVGSTNPSNYFTSTDFNSYNDCHVTEDPLFQKDGFLSVPSDPGLGIKVNDDILGKPILTLSS